MVIREILETYDGEIAAVRAYANARIAKLEAHKARVLKCCRSEGDGDLDVCVAGKIVPCEPKKKPQTTRRAA